MKSHLTLFQICTGTAYRVSVIQIFLSFMCNSPSNILQVPLWFKWQPLMQMILLMATVLEWFTAYYKDSLTSLWSPKQVNLHKPFAVALRKRWKCALKITRNLLIRPFCNWIYLGFVDILISYCLEFIMKATCLSYKETLLEYKLLSFQSTS